MLRPKINDEWIGEVPPFFLLELPTTHDDAIENLRAVPRLPAKRNIENEMIPTAIMTPMAWMARRRVKASM